MSEVMEELEKVIAKAAIDGTLSENAVKQFTDVLEQNEELSSSLKKNSQELSELRLTYTRTKTDLTSATAELAVYEERWKELSERESAAEVLAMTVKYEQKRVEDHKEMVGLIFRNTLLKRQAMTPGHHGHVDQYGTTIGAEYATKHDLEEKEE